MALNSAGIMAAMTSHAATLGVFEKVDGHEPKVAPKGVSCAFWVEDLGPIPARSGLASTSALLVASARIQMSMLREPQDGIDLALLHAADVLMNSFSGDFDLGGMVSHVDLLGAYWPGGMRGRAGYINQDNKMYRVIVISVPLVINDVWAQVS